MSSAVGGDDIYNQQQYPAASSTGFEPDSDAEDDPGKLLNAWLGQLNKDISTGENIYQIWISSYFSINTKRKVMGENFRACFPSFSFLFFFFFLRCWP